MSPGPAEPIAYEICVQGHLGQEWVDWFNYLTIQPLLAADGSPITKLRGPIPDQSALAGILFQLNEINIPIISVNPIHEESQFL
jgi:hypothetical protein